MLFFVEKAVAGVEPAATWVSARSSTTLNYTADRNKCKSKKTVAGVEPAATWSRARRSTTLSYTVVILSFRFFRFRSPTLLLQSMSIANFFDR